MYSKLAPQSSRFDLWALSQGRASSSSGRSFAGLTGCWSRLTWKRCQPSRSNSHPIRSLWNFKVSPIGPIGLDVLSIVVSASFFQETRYQPHNILWALLDACVFAQGHPGMVAIQWLNFFDLMRFWVCSFPLMLKDPSDLVNITEKCEDICVLDIINLRNMDGFPVFLSQFCLGVYV